MDAQDVSMRAEHRAVLEKRKKALSEARLRNGQRPNDRKPLHQLVDEYMAAYLGRQIFEQAPHSLRQSFVPLPYLPCIEPLKTLKKVYIRDLRLETNHRGRYIMLRSATPPTRLTGVMMIASDEKGDGVTLQLYHQQDEHYGPIKDLIQVNNVYIIKEPYFKTTSDGRYGVRVDHVSDISLLQGDDPIMPLIWCPSLVETGKTAAKWKEEGNALLRKGNLGGAVTRYSAGLVCSQTSEVTCLLKLNRSLALLRLSYYDAALKDAKESLISANTPLEVKGLYRVARCFYLLGNFGECQKSLLTLLGKDPHNEAASRDRSRTEVRLLEETHGKYDFGSMYTAAKINPPILDNATYIGPVCVKASKGRGRGLFTTQGVAAGDLLLCEKAFSYCHASDGASAPSNISILINTHTNRMTVGTQSELITATIQRLIHAPSLAPALTSLHHGDYEAIEMKAVDEQLPVDTFLVERILSLNVFGCPRTTLEDHFATRSPEDRQRQKYHHSCGLFLQASHINHSCFGNAWRSFIGDMQIVRAARSIPANTEVEFSYVLPGNDAQEKLQSAWGFQCTRGICENAEKTPKKTLKKRSMLMEDLKSAFGSDNGMDFAKAERLLVAIDKTYAVGAKEVPRLDLSDPYLLLTRVHIATDQPYKAIEAAFKGLASLGFAKTKDSSSPTSSNEVEQWGLMTDQVVEIWIHLWTCYGHVAPGLCPQVEQHAKTAYKICIGEDDTFEERYGGSVREAIRVRGNLVDRFQRMSV